MKESEGSGFWYLATPYSKHPGGTDNAFVDACRVAGQLVAAGVKVYCPIAHTHPIAQYGNIDRFSHEIWMPVDRPFMGAAGGLIVCCMPGWETSFGILSELDVFRAAGKPIVHIGFPVTGSDIERLKR